MANMMDTIFGLVMLIVVAVIGLVVATQSYQLNQSSFDSVSDVNIKTAAKNSVINAFEAMETGTDFTKIVIIGLFGGLAIAGLVSGIRSGSGGVNMGGGGSF